MNEHIPPVGRRGRPPREEVYRRLDTQIAELWQRMGGLPNPLEAADIWRGIWFEEAHHSTAIEGNTLVLKQVEVLLTEGRAVGAKELREYMEVRGYADSAEWVYRQAISPGEWSSGERLSLAELRQVHATAMKPVWDVDPHPDATEREGPGNFREHEIHPFPGGMQPVSWVLVPAEVEAWIAEVNALEPRSASFPEEIARLHSRFEQIHPFLDGNGRAGRLVLNLTLVRLGHPPAIIYKRQRSEYLRALQRAKTAIPDSSVSSSPERSSTTCTASSCPPSPDPRASSRSPHSRTRRSARTRCAPRRSAGASKRRADPTDSGGAPAIGSTTTCGRDTGAHESRATMDPNRPRRSLDPRCSARAAHRRSRLSRRQSMCSHDGHAALSEGLELPTS